MTLLLFLLLPLPIFIILLLQKGTRHGGTQLPPGPRGLPLIGNLHQLDRAVLHSYLCQLSQKYGPLMSLRLGFVPTIVVSSAKMAKEVYKTHDLTFSSRPSLRGLQRLSYNGLDVAFSPYNDYWKEMRKICTLHLFSSKNRQSFAPVREDEVSRMTDKIYELAISCKVVNLSEVVMASARTVICRIGFGKRFEEGYEGSRFRELLLEGQFVFASFFMSDHFPLMGWIDWLSGMNARLEKNFKDMDLFYQEIIEEHLDPNRPKSSLKDIVDILLQLKKDQQSSFDITFDHIKAVLMNVLVGGTDTGSAIVVWAMTELMKNPISMNKVQEEVRNMIGKKGRVEEDDLQKLPYFEAVVKETMRLHPPAPLLIPRETTQKCVIDGYEIPSKTLVYVNAWAIGRDPESWGRNAEEFLPERFLGSHIDFKGQDFELIPFGGGRRGCPGISMGVATVELALSNLLYSFDWELPDGMKKEDIDTSVRTGLTMHKKNDLCLLPKIYNTPAVV